MYVHFEAVRQLLAYNAAVEAGEEVSFQELSEWIEDLKYGAYQECIDLYQAISDQYKGDENRQGYPYSAVQQRRGFSDIYKGAPPGAPDSLPGRGSPRRGHDKLFV